MDFQSNLNGFWKLKDAATFVARRFLNFYCNTLYFCRSFGLHQNYVTVI